MNNMPVHSSAWVNFIYGSFATSLLMTGVGIFEIDCELWTKGYLAMGTIMLIMMSITLTKTIRDNQDNDRFNQFLSRNGQK